MAALESPDYPLMEWLAGPESHSKKPTPEYIAFCDLVDAYDEVKLRHKRGHYE